MGRCVYEPRTPRILVPPEAGRDGSNRKCQGVKRQIGEHCALGTCPMMYGTWIGWTCLENRERVPTSWVGGGLGDGAKQERNWKRNGGGGRAPSWRHGRTQDVVELRGPRTVEKGPLARVAVTGPQIGGLNCRDLFSHILGPEI